MKSVGVLALLALLLLPSALAAQGTIHLLAVVEGGGQTSGTLAKLELETQPGTGRVFLDTYPLTKIATQISMRFAEQVACAELDKDCTGTDFFFAVRASPGIVGGPSAGAAAAVLAAALIDGRSIDQSVGITGTINAGGLIGPVGGLPEKITAAGEGGLKTVLIPHGTALYSDNGTTTDLIALGKKIGVSVIEVSTLNEALQYVTGRPATSQPPQFTIQPEYLTTMKEVAAELCTHPDSTDEAVTNLTTLADTYTANGEFYSAASYCFRANIIQAQNDLAAQQPSLDELKDLAAKASVDALRLDGDTDRHPIHTMTDVQTLMLVKERIHEAQNSLAGLVQITRVTPNALDELAYAQERLRSAETWSKFFGIGGQQFEVDNETLAQSCQGKIGEAEERYSYLQSIYPQAPRATAQEIDRAVIEAQQGSYVLCLHDAAKAKAEADTVLAVTGVEEDRIQDSIQAQLDATLRSLSRAESKGTFPLIGYAYYEYAKALRTEDPSSSLLFAEYASELSSLDIYFGKPSPFSWSHLALLRDAAIGFIVGAVASGWCVWTLRRRQLPKKSRRAK
jgi:uncharacterized protein